LLLSVGWSIDDQYDRRPKAIVQFYLFDDIDSVKLSMDAAAGVPAAAGATPARKKDPR
jgi:hypothetical protein